jgi:hypothetical protein
VMVDITRRQILITERVQGNLHSVRPQTSLVTRINQAFPRKSHVSQSDRLDTNRDA